MRKNIFKIFAVIIVLNMILTGCSKENKAETDNSSNEDNNAIVSSTPAACDDNEGMARAKKPVIYLYPESEQKVSVKLNLKGKLTCTYPNYQDGWEVVARPDGTLINTADNREYSYLYWEGITDNKWDMSKGFVVKGTDTEKFLKEKLAYMGLLPKEYNEFIVYWLPILQENPYNLITFAGEEYENAAQLHISPKPDSMLRIMMLYRPLEKPVIIEAQDLKPFVRQGFTVVEWGGTLVK